MITKQNETRNLINYLKETHVKLLMKKTIITQFDIEEGEAETINSEYK